jgi:site-specific DNA-adenine methylase
MLGLQPFFCYYGGKWRAAPHYPKPKCDLIIEPFAGAAGYASRYYERDVLLVEADPKIAAMWKWLISSTFDEIMALPSNVKHIDNENIKDEAKTLIGFWLNKGAAQPCKQPSAWMRSGLRPNSYWGDTVKNKIANQVVKIKHWSCINESFEKITNHRATWFIDPPYVNAGKLYKYSSNKINYSFLSEWCKTRDGQVIVCENNGATWLPFKPFVNIKSTPGKRGKSVSREAIWENENL